MLEFGEGGGVTISVVNQAKTPLGVDLEALVAALQIQIDRDFAPVWGTGCTLKIETVAPTGTWTLVFRDIADQPGALGYHEDDENNLPVGFVFVKTTIDDNELVSVTASHELMEMLVNPAINQCYMSSKNVLYIAEVSDAVQEDSYKINDIAVSDFVYPAWFEDFWKQGQMQFSHLGSVDAPFELAKGGYISTWNPRRGWGQIFGSKAAAAKFNPKKKYRMHKLKQLAAAIVALICLTASGLAGDLKILDFGTEWCGPCKAMAPAVDELIAKHYPIQRVDAEKQPDLAERYGVRSYPTLIMIDGQGLEIDRSSEFRTAEAIAWWLKSKTPQEKAPAARIESGAAASETHFMRLLSVEVLAKRGKMVGFASGTIIRVHGNKAIVLTVRHETRQPQTSTFYVRMLGGSTHAARFVGASRWADLAALEIATPPDVAARITREFPEFANGRTWELETATQPASHATMYGWAGENDGENQPRKIGKKSGRLLNAKATDDGMIAYAFSPELGDSGGGSWTTGGEFLGVLSGRDRASWKASRTAYIVGPAAVNDFLMQECCLGNLFKHRTGPGSSPPPQTVTPEPTVVRGPEGPAGKNGKDGINGTDGKDGTNAVTATPAKPIPIAFESDGPNGTQTLITLARPATADSPADATHQVGDRFKKGDLIYPVKLVLTAPPAPPAK